MNYIDNTQDIIYVQDIIDRVEELESLQGEDAECATEQEEQAELRSVLSELAGYGGDVQFEGEWYPHSLIRDTYFETAMDGLLEDCGYIPRDLPCFLSITVDYEALRMDYSSIEIAGETYWYR